MVKPDPAFGDHPDYSSYEFSWEPGRFRVRWSLTRRDRRGKPEGMGPLARGRAFTLDKARRDAFAEMTADAFADALPGVPRVEDGNELTRKVQARDLAERHV